MKKVLAVLSVLLMLAVTTTAFAGGDKNKNRHDGSKGQGPTKQERVNK
jgi:hypothetical protein